VDENGYHGRSPPSPAALDADSCKPDYPYHTYYTDFFFCFLSYYRQESFYRLYTFSRHLHPLARSLPYTHSSAALGAALGHYPSFCYRLGVLLWSICDDDLPPTIFLILFSDL
jgi:hypothetical protein